MTRQMFDSVTAKRLPPNATLVGAYTDGHYANEAAVRKQCPHATVVTITTRAPGKPGARCADVETGDLTPEEGARWAANEVKDGRKPTIYMNASTWDEVKRHVAAHGLTGHVSYWVAHYDNIAQIPPGAVAKQYIERTDQNLDYSIAADYWPGVDPEPKHVTPHPAARPAPPHPQAKPGPHPAWWAHPVKLGDVEQEVDSVCKRLGLPDRVTFDPDLDAHVRYVQKAHGLPITGVVDARTAEAIG